MTHFMVFEFANCARTAGENLIFQASQLPFFLGYSVCLWPLNSNFISTFERKDIELNGVFQ